MKVIFLEHVLHVAKKWEIKDVSSGYASNFLFPKKIAKLYTDEIGKKIASEQQKRESNKRTLLWSKSEIIEQLSWWILEVEVQAVGSKIHGSISPKDIAELIVKKYKYPITKKHIDFWWVHSSLKQLWDHDIYVDLWDNFATKMIVRINSIH